MAWTIYICSIFLPSTLAILYCAQIMQNVMPHVTVYLCVQIIGRDCIIDVHKWDYLARNSRGLNIPCGLDPSIFRRFLQCIQLDKDQEVLMIRDKVSALSNSCEVCMTYCICDRKHCVAPYRFVRNVLWEADASQKSLRAQDSHCNRIHVSMYI